MHNNEEKLRGFRNIFRDEIVEPIKSVAVVANIVAVGDVLDKKESLQKRKTPPFVELNSNVEKSKATKRLLDLLPPDHPMKKKPPEIPVILTASEETQNVKLQQIAYFDKHGESLARVLVATVGDKSMTSILFKPDTRYEVRGYQYEGPDKSLDAMIWRTQDGGAMIKDITGKVHPISSSELIKGKRNTTINNDPVPGKMVMLDEQLGEMKPPRTPSGNKNGGVGLG
ncbi:MAG: hypothetical protein EB060_11135 [Proteobacteria bacterium]|nr:hypothetical protein [Pseudomonadota bacterium]